MIGRLLLLALLLAVSGGSTLALDQGGKEKGFAIIQPKEEAEARERYGCPALTHKICKDASGRCGPVYISGEQDDNCIRLDKEKIQRLCGTPAATLYNSDGECIKPPVSNNCPASIEVIRQHDVEMIYQCPGLYSALCRELCGARYDQTDIREFYQTGGKPGLVCSDGSVEETKAGEGYSGDRTRHNCFRRDKDFGSGSEIHEAASGTRTWCGSEIHEAASGTRTWCGSEIHEAASGTRTWCGSEIHEAASGTRTWCISYNKIRQGVNFSAFVQCVGRLRQ